MRAFRQTAAAFLGRHELLILLLLAPLFLFPMKLTVVALLSLPLLWTCARTVGSSVITRTPLDGALLLLAIMLLVSVYATPDVTYSLPKIVGLIYGIVCFYAAVRWATQSPDRLGLALLAFIFAGSLFAFIALLGTNWLSKVPYLAEVSRKLPHSIRGLPGAAEGFHPNAVGGTLVFFIPLQLTMLASTWRKEQIGLIPWIPRPGLVAIFAQLAALALTTGALLLSQSRGAWLGLAAGLIGVLLLHRKWTQKVFLGLLLLGAVLLVVAGPEKAANLVTAEVGAGMKDNTTSRLELWSRAIYGIGDFPISGMGMNMFRRVMPVFYPSFTTPPDLDVAHAHNHLLQVALDLGFPGLVAYLALWLGAGSMLLMVIRLAEDQWMKDAALGLSMGLASHFIFGIGDSVPLGAKIGIVFWMVLALVVSLFLRVCSQGSGARKETADD